MHSTEDKRKHYKRNHGIYRSELISRYGKKVYNNSGKFKRTLIKCCYCSNMFSCKYITVDHIIPISNGGNNNIDNLILSCESCNRSKSNNHILIWSFRIFKNSIKHYCKIKLIDMSKKCRIL